MGPTAAAASSALSFAINTTGAVSNTWQTGASMPTARGGAIAVTKNALTYVIGGCTTTCWASNVNEAYNPATNSWTTKAPMLTPRASPSAALGQNGLIYVMGGATSDENGVTGANEAYNPSTDTWTVSAAMPPPRWAAAAATGSDGLIYTFGGFAGYVATVEAYDPRTNKWTCSVGDASAGCTDTTIPPIPVTSYRGAAVAIGDSIYVMIGLQDGSLTNAVWAYNVTTKEWTQKAPMPSSRPSPGAAVATILASNAPGIYVIGGATFGNLASNAVEVYDPTTNR